mmetsp:Transcript_25158/g.34585  ORF Transcript_25158/g.34585 Transcript_25158/m.34585 type:complete len:118 (+) Transcript_25158:137-490(+)
MTTQPREIGGIDSSVQIRKSFATLSRQWRCRVCGISHNNPCASNALLTRMDLRDRILTRKKTSTSSKPTNNSSSSSPTEISKHQKSHLMYRQMAKYDFSRIGKFLLLVQASWRCYVL